MPISANWSEGDGGFFQRHQVRSLCPLDGVVVRPLEVAEPMRDCDLKALASAGQPLPQEPIAAGHSSGPVLRLTQARTLGGLETVVAAGNPLQLHS
jgi:hypothetical protein